MFVPGSGAHSSSPSSCVCVKNRSSSSSSSSWLPLNATPSSWAWAWPKRCCCSCCCSCCMSSSFPDSSSFPSHIHSDLTVILSSSSSSWWHWHDVLFGIGGVTGQFHGAAWAKNDSVFFASGALANGSTNHFPAMQTHQRHPTHTGRTIYSFQPLRARAARAFLCFVVVQVHATSQQLTSPPCFAASCRRATLQPTPRTPPSLWSKSGKCSRSSSASATPTLPATPWHIPPAACCTKTKTMATSPARRATSASPLPRTRLYHAK